MSQSTGILERFLGDRSRLEFHYPDSKGTIVFLPFYENIDIKESQNANYAKYSPIGRAGSLYTYTGSESRKFKLKIPYTLDHLAQHEVGIGRFMRIALNNTDEDWKNLFTQFTELSKHGQGGTQQDSHSYAARKFFRTLFADKYGITPAEYEKVTAQPPGSTGYFPEMLVQVGSDLAKAYAENTTEYTQRDKVIDTLLFFVAILRSTTLNNALDPLYGPPILRLTHGTLYQSVPCICKNYDISWEEEAGYDLHTLTPRRLMINLTLEEVRSSTFEPYEARSFVNRNALAGWEQTIKEPWTTDPTDRAFRD